MEHPESFPLQGLITLVSECEAVASRIPHYSTSALHFKIPFQSLSKHTSPASPDQTLSGGYTEIAIHDRPYSGLNEARLIHLI